MRLTREAVVQLAGTYGIDTEKRNELEGRIDRELGEGTGRQVFDALEGLLGGGKRRTSPD